MDTFSERTVIYGEAGIADSAGAASAVSWGAILAGALAAAALSLIMFILGIGLGLTSVSPWSQEGISAEAFGVSAIAWITFTSLVASGLGGYLTGRLRTRWASTHTDEVYFRDTAHGFLAWGLATLLTAFFFSSVMASIASGTVRAGAAVASGAADTAATAATALAGGAAAGSAAEMEGSDNNSLSYFLDTLFRREPGAVADVPAQPAPPPPQPAADAGDAAANAGADATTEEGLNGNTAVQQDIAAAAAQPAQVAPAAPPLAEAGRIFMRAISQGMLDQDDLDYLAQQVASHTGISANEAQMRVQQTFDDLRADIEQLETSAREAADTARATTAYVSLWFFISLLIGAFVGSFAATFGGRQRDL